MRNTSNTEMGQITHYHKSHQKTATTSSDELGIDTLEVKFNLQNIKIQRKPGSICRKCNGPVENTLSIHNVKYPLIFCVNLTQFSVMDSVNLLSF